MELINHNFSNWTWKNFVFWKFSLIGGVSHTGRVIARGGSTVPVGNNKQTQLWMEGMGVEAINAKSLGWSSVL